MVISQNLIKILAEAIGGELQKFKMDNYNVYSLLQPLYP